MPGAVLPHMYEQAWGPIVDISGVHGVRASPFKSAYVAAKHRLDRLAKVVALEGVTTGRRAVLRLPTDATVPATYRPSTKVHGLIQWGVSSVAGLAVDRFPP